jgi:hypothetical protein
MRDPSEPSRRKITRDVIVEAHGLAGDADHGDFVIEQGAALRITRRSGERNGQTDVVALPGFPRAGKRFEAEDPRVAIGVGGVLIDGATALVLTGGIDSSVPATLTSLTTSVLVYDIDDEPRHEATVSFAGSVLSARVIDGDLRIVSSTPASDQLPRYTVVRDGRRVRSGSLIACDSTWVPQGGHGAELVTVAHFALPAGAASHQFSFLASPVGVTATDHSLILATNAPTDDTWVHRSDDSGNVASVRVPGRLLAGWGDDPLNRWSLSEYGDDVRIVTRDPAGDGEDAVADPVRTIVSFATVGGDQLRSTGRVIKRSPPGTLAGVRMLGTIGVIEPHGSPRRSSIELIDLEGYRLAGTLAVGPERTGYLALENSRLLTKRGDRAPYTYTLFDVRDADHPKVIETLRARTRFWSHAIELFNTDVVPVEGMPDDV